MTYLWLIFWLLFTSNITFALPTQVYSVYVLLKTGLQFLSTIKLVVKLRRRRAAQIKEIKILKQRAVSTNPTTKTRIYISRSVVKNHCLRLPWALSEGKNLICAFFAGPRCHKEFHFPLFIHLYFTDGSCSCPLHRLTLHPANPSVF